MRDFFTKALMKIRVCWHATPCRLANIDYSLYAEGSVQNTHIQSANIQGAHYIQVLIIYRVLIYRVLIIYRMLIYRYSFYT